MPNKVVSTDRMYRRIELDESDFESLLQSWAAVLFPGFKWFKFKPPIVSPEGVSHPDAALISSSGEWWVVEVETSRHSIRTHIDSQLGKLATGYYSPASYDYLMANYPEQAELFEQIRFRGPRFLVIVDDYSTMIDKVAHDHGFDVLSVLPFISPTPPFAYVGAVAGYCPGVRVQATHIGFVAVLEEIKYVSKLRFIDAHRIPDPATHVLIANRLVRCRSESDGISVVLSLAVNEMYELIGEHEFYVYRIDESGLTTIIPLPRGA